MALVTGNVSTFGRGTLRLPGRRLLFIPPTFGVAGDYMLASAPVPATIDATTDEFTVELEPVTDLRPPVDASGRPWGYGVRLEWLDSASNFTGVDFPNVRVFVPPEGGPIGPMLDSPILPFQVWDTEPGVIPAGARSGDLIINYRPHWLGKII